MWLSDGEGDDHEARGRLHEAGGNSEGDSGRAGGGEERHGDRRGRRVSQPLARNTNQTKKTKQEI